MHGLKFNCIKLVESAITAAAARQTRPEQCFLVLSCFVVVSCVLVLSSGKSLCQKSIKKSSSLLLEQRALSGKSTSQFSSGYIKLREVECSAMPWLETMQNWKVLPNSWNKLSPRWIQPKLLEKYVEDRYTASFWILWWRNWWYPYFTLLLLIFLLM